MGFLTPFFQALIIILDVLKWTILIWVIFSWILFFLRDSKVRWRNPKAYRVLAQLDEVFSRMTYPFLTPFRRLMRRFDTRGIDWSPLLLLVSIYILQGLIAEAYRLILSR
jgi:uncharacterized protein YggT (Ycf19 family)